MLTSVVVTVGFETTTYVFVLALVFVAVAGEVPVTVSTPYPPDGGKLVCVPVVVDAGCVDPPSESTSRSVRAPQADGATARARRASRSPRTLSYDPGARFPPRRGEDRVENAQLPDRHGVDQIRTLPLDGLQRKRLQRVERFHPEQAAAFLRRETIEPVGHGIGVVGGVGRH